jgi:ABC-type lipoprotein export system ATPase subunit
MDLLRKLARERDATIIVVTHDERSLTASLIDFISATAASSASRRRCRRIGRHAAVPAAAVLG